MCCVMEATQESILRVSGEEQFPKMDISYD